MGTKHTDLNTRLAQTIVLKPVTWLKPYERNARTHSAQQLDEIAGSIAEFGFTNPILAKADGTIIAGHGRLEASITRLGLKEVPVIILDYLTDKQAQILVLADNKIAMNAGWDDEMLAAELAAMEADGLDLSLTGFSAEELEDILGHPDDLDDEPAAATETESDFKKKSFELHKKQAATVERALRWAVNAGDFTDGLNDDTDANALARIAAFYIEHNKEVGAEVDKKKRKPAAKKGAAGKGK